jgi:hypothetical protein
MDILKRLKHFLHMKKLNFFLILIFGISSTAFSQSFYDINTINTIEITFEQSNWDYLLDQLVSAGNEDRLMGSVAINGQVFDSVGVRYKGNSSYKSNQVKNPLNIKLDYIINDQEIEGYGTLKLANAYNDPSFVREVLSYEIARKYFPASEANYANVYVNGTHLGLYSSVQDVDKFFMRTHFGGDETVRVKGEIEGNAQPGQMGGVWEYFGTDTTDYDDFYELESDYGWEKLVEFIDTLNNHYTYVDRLLNIDRHLWFLAFSNLLVNLDGPINNPQNYYLFEDGTGRFNPIPWDLNESFGVFAMLQSSGNLNTYQLQHLSHVVNLNESDYPIIRRILNNDTYRLMYVAHMKTMLEDNFSNGWYETRALEIQDIIDEAVQNDPNKFYSYSNFISNINSSVGGGGWPPSPGVIGITQLMDTRASWLAALSEFQAQAPGISNINYSPQLVSPNTGVWFLSTVSSATEVYLAYRQSSVAAFEKVEMFDDGNHHDGSAGDGVYGVSIVVGSSDIQYYIYAENNSAAAFSPPNAEYEFYSIEVNSTLVINEFMADNESTVTDQDGEYEDWVEIFNTGESVLAMGGYFLSDDASEPDQWTFPDTTIAAGGYLVVWADDDEDQDGLHANFKLSKSGESIILSNPSITVVDEYSFSQQVTDSTTGRFPNGIGDFVLMLPTFGVENQSLINANQTITIPGGWSGISSYLDPDDPLVADIFSELTLSDQLIILQNMTDVYWPDAGINTIDQNGGWDTQSGYMVKLSGDQELVIEGAFITNKTLNLDEAGWYLIPVLSNCSVPVTALLEDVLDDLVIIKDVAGTAVYWPGVVQKLYSLEPGKSYLVKFSAPVSITFPECTDVTE